MNLNINNIATAIDQIVTPVLRMNCNFEIGIVMPLC